MLSVINSLGRRHRHTDDTTRHGQNRFLETRRQPARAWLKITYHMIELCNILIQFFYDRGWLFQMPPNPQSKQFFFSEFSVKDECIVELSEEGMCDRL